MDESRWNNQRRELIEMSRRLEERYGVAMRCGRAVLTRDDALLLPLDDLIRTANDQAEAVNLMLSQFAAAQIQGKYWLQ